MGVSLLNSVASLKLIHVLDRIGRQQQVALLRLSTGLRINSAEDDPAGLIALSSLHVQSAALAAAGENAQRADTMLATAEGGLAEVSDLLVEMEALAVEAASGGGLSEEELDAIQMQIDSAVDAIDDIVGATEFNGTRLFGGDLDYQTSGLAASQVTDLAIYAASPRGQATTIAIELTDSAELAQLVFSGAGLASGNDVELQLTGNAGTATVSLAASSTIAEIASAVNADTDVTGVSAVASGGHVYFYSTAYGSEQFISVEAMEGDFDLVGGQTTDYGADAAVQVNGVTASVSGLRVRAASGELSLSFELTELFNQAGGTSSFAVTGGGATFALGSGAGALVGVGLPRLGAARLGSASLGYLSGLATGGSHDMQTDPAGAREIIERAASQISTLRGQLGATQRFVIGAASNNLESMMESVADAASDLGDADYAQETAELIRTQVLAAATTAGLAAANQSASRLLELLLA